MNQALQIFKNTMVLGAARLIERTSTILLSFFVSRVLQATGLGIYSSAIAYYTLIALAAEMGATNLMVREIAKDRERTNSYLLHLAVMGGGLAAILTGVSLLIVPHLGYSADLAASVSLVIVGLVPGTLNTIQEAVFVAHQRAEFITYTTLVSACANVGISLLLLLTGHGVVSLVIAFVAIQYIITICYFFFINRYIARLHWEFQFAFARRLIHEIKGFTASSLLAGLFARPEIIILSFVTTEAQIGYYTASLKVVDLWQLIPQTYMINIFPVLSRSYHQADQKSQTIQDKSIKYLLAVSLPLAAGLMVAAGPIIRLLYGPGFEPSVGLLQLLAWNVPLVALNSVLWRVLAARGEQNRVVRVQVVTTFVRLAGGYLLMAALASAGGAITIVGSILLHNQLLSAAIRRDGTPLPVLRLSWRFLLAAAGMAGAVWFFVPQWPLWLLVPIAAAVYAGLVLVFGGLARDDVALLRLVWRAGLGRRGSAAGRAVRPAEGGEI